MVAIKESEMGEWFEDESFWIETYHHIFPEERFRTAGEQIEQALVLAGLEVEHVLDLCCGPGRHSIALARRGINVTAVDRTKYLLDKAIEAAQDKNLQIEFVLEDMRSFVRPNGFDMALNIFTSFGYFGDKSEDLKVLRNVYESLRPGGVFLIEITGKEPLARSFQATTSQEAADGSLLVLRHEILEDWTRASEEWTLIRGGRVKTFKFQHTIYSGQELKDLLTEACFAEVKLYGGLNGCEYGVDAARLVALARKKK